MLSARVRRLEAADISAMQRLRRAALSAAPWAFLATEADDLALDAEHVARSVAAPERAAIFLAWVEGQPAGMVGVIRETRAKIRHRAQIWGMYVDSTTRGGGLGRELLEAALAHVRGWSGVEQVHLCVAARADAARRLYERAGFTTWGVQPRAMLWGDTTLDEHHMVLQVSAEA